MANFYKNFASETLMSFGKSFARLNGQPLDKSAIWYSKDEADAYAATGSAYVGQPVAVIDEAAGKTTLYVVGAAGALEMVGSLPDGVSLELHEGKVQLKGFNDAEAGAQLRKNADGELEWFVPSTETVDGLQSTVGGLKTDVENAQKDIEALEGLVGTETVEAQIDAKIEELDLVNTYEEKGAAATAKGEIEAVIGEVAEGKTVVKMIEDAQAAATYDDTQVKADIKTNADAIAAIEADYLKEADKYDDTELSGRVTAVEGDVATIKGDYLKKADKTELEGKITAAEDNAVDRVLGYLAEEEVNTSFDTLKEIAAWIESDTTASAELVTRISDIEKDYLQGADKEALQKQIDDLETYVGTLPEGAAATTIVAYIKEVVDALKIGDYAKAADLNDLAERVTAAEEDIGDINDALKGKVDVAEGYRLMSDAEGAQLAGLDAALAGKVDVEEGKGLSTNDFTDALLTKLNAVAEGAEVNVIKSVDLAQFGLDDNKHLTLLDIAMGKVTGLEDALGGKVDKIDGYRLMSPDEQTKLGKLVLGEDGKVEVSAEISAANVKELNTWITNNRDTVLGLFSTADAAKLEGIAANSQVNVLEGVQVGGTLLDIVEKKVNIPVATADVFGVVKSAAGENKVAVAADGTMEVNSLNVNKLAQNDGEYMIMNGGNAALN